MVYKVGKLSLIARKVWRNTQDINYLNSSPLLEVILIANHLYWVYWVWGVQLEIGAWYFVELHLAQNRNTIFIEICVILRSLLSIALDENHLHIVKGRYMRVVMNRLLLLLLLFSWYKDRFVVWKHLLIDMH